MDKIIDLDILAPEKVIIKFEGEEYDIGFIPVAVALSTEKDRLELDTLRQAHPHPEKGDPVNTEIVNLSIKILSAIMVLHDKKFTPEYLINKMSTIQAITLIGIADMAVRRSMISAYRDKGGEDENPTKATGK